MKKAFLVVAGVLAFAASDASAQTWSVDPANPLPERNRSIERALPATNQRTTVQDPLPVPRVGGLSGFLAGPVTDFQSSPFVVGSRVTVDGPQVAERSVEPSKKR